MWQQRPEHGKGGVDIETGRLYPTMLESPELPWSFIRKIYSILAIQMLLSVGISAAFVTVKPISNIFVTTPPGLGLYIFIIIFSFIVFTVTLSFANGLTCAFVKGKVILESAILTTMVVVSLTLCTFWAARKGHDFNFLRPFLFSAVMILMVFALIQLFIPIGRIYGALSAIICCGFIIYDTDNLIKRYSYDEYVWVALYLDIINIFLSLLALFRAADG